MTVREVRDANLHTNNGMEAGYCIVQVGLGIGAPK